MYYTELIYFVVDLIFTIFECNPVKSPLLIFITGIIFMNLSLLAIDLNPDLIVNRGTMQIIIHRFKVEYHSDPSG